MCMCIIDLCEYCISHLPKKISKSTPCKDGSMHECTGWQSTKTRHSCHMMCLLYYSCRARRQPWYNLCNSLWLANKMHLLHISWQVQWLLPGNVWVYWLSTLVYTIQPPWPFSAVHIEIFVTLGNSRPGLASSHSCHSTDAGRSCTEWARMFNQIHVARIDNH